MVITPPKAHIKVDVSFRAGMLPMRTVGDPGAQGAGVTGIHGKGVRTPPAAVVALRTAGFAGLEHMMKVGMFLTGMLSMIVAAGWEWVNTLFSGVTTSTPGASPKGHCKKAPLQTCIGIFFILING
jgi:hypothetical protein